MPDLKSKEPRLRDWNAKCNRWSGIGSPFLEIKRTSITRLKLPDVSLANLRLQTWNQKNLDYEIETGTSPNSPAVPSNLKSKEPRLRDWNHSSVIPPLQQMLWSWNQKNLDYEIETSCCVSVGTSDWTLKSKEPRLRDWNDDRRTAPSMWDQYLKSKEPRLRDWNGYWSDRFRSNPCKLEIKRTLITRLKLNRIGVMRARNRTWNQKNLDYEIETSPYSLWRKTGEFPWNQKNLDYEIETETAAGLNSTRNSLKSKEPRLRDWNNLTL